jgi:DNA replication and repair protein RecF
VLVTGDNGAGKTNLLEALHVGTQGFSPRTRAEGQLVRFGEERASLQLRLVRNGVDREVRLRFARGEAKEAELDGARLASAEQLRREFPALVFTPDRLAVVKGAPAARRAYFDRAAGRLHPARLAVPQDYASALAQRNAALKRIQLGLSGRDALAPWSERVAALGAELVALRRDTVASLGPGFGERAAELGLADARLAHDAEAPGTAELEARIESDVARGVTGLGPHLDDVRVLAGDRDLRSFGSQGEQRLAVLSLLLAETELLAREPLLLLDDVLSELDPSRRRVLAGRVAELGQVVITATERTAFPLDPAQVVEVTPGQAR